jgi:cytoskeletal protein RodZ
MVQNNKSKNSSTSGGLDITSWIIAIIATLLIIGGVYLLVISLNPTAKPTTVVRSTSSQVTTSGGLSSSASIASTAATASAQSSQEVVASSSAAVSSTVSSATVSSTASTAPVVAPLKTGQTNAELIGRVDGISAGLIKITVTESGFTNTRWLRQGVFTNILATYIPNAQIGESYKISFDIGSSQADGSFVINDLKVVDKVK